MSDIPDFALQDMKAILESVIRRPQGVCWKGRLHTAAWHGGAVSVKYGFAAVLERCTRLTFSMYFMSDNMSEDGDIHLGPFSTRNFVKYLQDNNLGTIVTAGPVTSLNTDRDIQGWIFLPHWKSITKHVKKLRLELITYYKELNNDPRIKEPEQARRKQSADRSKELADQFCGGWTDWPTRSTSSE